MLNPIHVGDEVFWTDPDDGYRSGACEVLKSPDGEEENKNASAFDVITLGMEEGDVLEVFRHELS